MSGIDTSGRHAPSHRTEPNKSKRRSGVAHRPTGVPLSKLKFILFSVLALPPRLLFRRSGNIGGTTHASTESAGRNRPKSPILYGSWSGGSSDADATDHRDHNPFRDL